MIINKYLIPTAIGILTYTVNLILGYEYNQWQFWFMFIIFVLVAYSSYPLHKFMIEEEKDAV